MKYCEAIYRTSRFPTREVRVGDVGVGGSNPIRIQSMTTSNTRDAEATGAQILRLAESGCEIARVTVQGKKEAEALEAIKNFLIQRGARIPLVADIHFYPPAALLAAEFADKVRINPGNFVDKRASFKIIEYDDAAYAAELEKIEAGFAPLVEKCKRLKRAMRIGTNHGSLSDRIMNRFGDSPRGMVESALEFARVCRKYDYHDIIFSMKASNPVVMIAAYRLLAAEMIRLGWDYPLHLGVTEAGEGEDGRIKSAMGIGALLLDGLGDTIRVSLTEDPWAEIDPCKRLVCVQRERLGKGIEPFVEHFRDIENIQKRAVEVAAPLHPDGSVILKVDAADLLRPTFFEEIGCEIQGAPKDASSLGKEVQGAPKDASSLGKEVQGAPKDASSLGKEVQGAPKDASSLGKEVQGAPKDASSLGKEVQGAPKDASSLGKEIQGAPKDASSLGKEVQFGRPKRTKQTADALWIDAMPQNSKIVDQLAEIGVPFFVKPNFHLFRPTRSPMHETRRYVEELKTKNDKTPLILAFEYDCGEADLPIQAGAEMGALLCDGLAEGVCLIGKQPLALRRRLSFNLLQSARMRTVKTDFISCPGCGRTLFDLQETSRRIREKTAHLPGVKIAIMGCIVNGPGEMADADFGYVGSKPGKIDLYLGRKCVERDIDFADADQKLIDLIKVNGKWTEPQEI